MLKVVPYCDNFYLDLFSIIKQKVVPAWNKSLHNDFDSIMLKL